MKYSVRRLASFGLLIIGCVGGALVVPAAADDSGITVSAFGQATAKPDVAEFTITAGGTAKKATEALKKYSITRQRLTKAFEELKLDKLTIRQSPIAYQNVAGDSGYVVSRKLTLQLAGIAQLSEDELNKTLAKVMDKAAQVNAPLGASNTATIRMMAMMGQSQSATSAVIFVLENSDPLRKQAYQDAFAKAKSQAEQLAGLAGLKLGPPVSIQATSVATSNGQSPQEKMVRTIYGIEDDATEITTRITSDRFKKIQLHVKLRVRFSTQ